MKSTKIEDILADEIEETSETNINEIKQDDVQDELRDQLESLKSELSMIKKDTTENMIQPTVNTVNNDEKKTEVDRNMDQEIGVLEKLLKFDKVDVKQTLIISLLYVITNSLYINEMIDNMIPYSLYSYTFAIKLLLFLITFRLLNSIDF
jgi:hypothetical protein